MEEEKRSKRASCKIDVNIYDKLKEIADKKNMSVYRYMNEILSQVIEVEETLGLSPIEMKDYLEFYSKMENLDTLPLPVEFLSKHTTDECYRYGSLLSSINYENKDKKDQLIAFLARFLSPLRPNKTANEINIIFRSVNNDIKNCLEGLIKGFFETLDLKEHEDFELDSKSTYIIIKVK